jgi:hypothetical protein
LSAGKDRIFPRSKLQASRRRKGIASLPRAIACESCQGLVLTRNVLAVLGSATISCQDALWNSGLSGSEVNDAPQREPRHYAVHTPFFGCRTGCLRSSGRGVVGRRPTIPWTPKNRVPKVPSPGWRALRPLVRVVDSFRETNVTRLWKSENILRRSSGTAHSRA